MTAVFEIDRLSFDVPGRTLLNDLSLTLPAGQVIGLIGHNGSGKSTLLKLLARQANATSGTVCLDGVPIAEWRARALARRLAYLPQHLPSAEGLLVRELVALGRYPWHGALGRPGQTDRAAVEHALEACGLIPLAEQRVDTLSGGEAQRAWLAMLIAQEAGCLLLDEPISALDIVHQVEVLRLVQNLSRARGRSVVLVLHDLNMAARFCDHIVALNAGRLAFQGRPETLMSRETLRGIYGTGMEVLSRADGTPVALPD
jgi:iron complex transport system ATP-binding protein